MKKFFATACAAVASVSLMANAVSAATIADVNHWKPMFVLPTHPQQFDPGVLDALGNASKTVPTWSGSVKSPLDGNTYSYKIIGSAPGSTPKTTTIHYVPIVVKIKFANGVILDPTKPGCNDTVSVSDRFFKGPLFNAVPVSSNGIAVGPAQLTDAFQRAEFWKVIKGSPNYHIVLKSTLATPLILNVNAPAGSQTASGVCAGSAHDIGEIDINAYDSLVQAIVNKYAKPNQLPLVLSYNTFETEGGCCIIGYHNAYSRPGGVQTYAISAYNDAGIFSVPIEDIHAWQHEIGEWMNDPFINNATPAWGHIGQVSGCQNNFEVGDALTGTPYLIKYNGFTYHPQELVFYSWFYRVPSTGTGGLFSFEGTFKAAQGACT